MPPPPTSWYFNVGGIATFADAGKQYQLCQEVLVLVLVLFFFFFKKKVLTRLKNNSLFKKNVQFGQPLSWMPSRQTLQDSPTFLVWYGAGSRWSEPILDRNKIKIKNRVFNQVPLVCQPDESRTGARSFGGPPWVPSRRRAVWMRLACLCTRKSHPKSSGMLGRCVSRASQWTRESVLLQCGRGSNRHVGLEKSLTET